MALRQSLQTVTVLCLLGILFEACRRLFFHPLAHIPGPKLAALTWWYECYFDVFQQGRYVFKIQELHKQYGPIIRITPDEVHVDDVGFLDPIYAPSTSRRDKYAYQLRGLRLQGSIGSTIEHNIHKKRREALAPFFSKRNVLYLEPLITAKVEQLCQLLKKHADDKTPVNLSDALFAFSNDVVNNFLFARQTDVLADEEKAANLRKNSYELLKGIHFNKHFSWIPALLSSLPKSVSQGMMPPGLADLLDLISRARSEVVQIMNAKSSGKTSQKPLGPTGKESVYDSVLNSSVLPPEEKSLQRLTTEGALLVLAGTESPAKSLTVIFYHLLANPQILTKLREELSQVPRPATWSQLEHLPYLSAVIEEGNRLSFGVTTRMVRIAYEPLSYTPSIHATSASASASAPSSKSYPIPPGTPVSTTSLAAHTAESVFPDPFAFKPERWLGEEGRERRKFQMAFSKGSRKCLGIELARAELYLVVERLVRGFEMRLWETGVGEVGFVHACQVAMPDYDAKGVRAVVEAL